MNASRVIGPIIGTTIYAAWGPSWVFLLNAVSFGVRGHRPGRCHPARAQAARGQGLHRLLEGFEVARQNRVIGQCLVVIFVFSFFCLPFISLMPKIADINLHIAPKSSAYGLLYACFGIGAVLGALSIGTVFASSSKPLATRVGLVGFAVMVLVFGILHTALPAYAAILVLGAVYFAVITSLSTVLQQTLDDAVRGKVMALWIMGFGGTVPFGGMFGGWVSDLVGITPMIALSSLVALGLAWWGDLLPQRPAGLLAARRLTAAACWLSRRLAPSGERLRHPLQAGGPAGLHQHHVAVTQAQLAEPSHGSVGRGHGVVARYAVPGLVHRDEVDAQLVGQLRHLAVQCLFTVPELGHGAHHRESLGGRQFLDGA